MRFYRHSRPYRMWGSFGWGIISLVWISICIVHRARHPWQPLMWIALVIMQLGSLWTSWEITPTELIAQGYGIKRRIQLSAIEGVGRPEPHRKMLRKTVQVLYRGRHAMYISVADREGFERTLRRAVSGNDHGQPTGPLGLTV